MPPDIPPADSREIVLKKVVTAVLRELRFLHRLASYLLGRPIR